MRVCSMIYSAFTVAFWYISNSTLYYTPNVFVDYGKGKWDKMV